MKCSEGTLAIQTRYKNNHNQSYKPFAFFLNSHTLWPITTHTHQNKQRLFMQRWLYALECCNMSLPLHQQQTQPTWSSFTHGPTNSSSAPETSAEGVVCSEPVNREECFDQNRSGSLSPATDRWTEAIISVFVTKTPHESVNETQLSLDLHQKLTIQDGH